MYLHRWVLGLFMEYLGTLFLLPLTNKLRRVAIGVKSAELLSSFNL